MQTSIRDKYIIAQALYEFVRMQQQMVPDKLREHSNEEDAIRILKEHFPVFIQVFLEMDKYSEPERTSPNLS